MRKDEDYNKYYIINKQIYSGNISTVYEATSKETNEKRALKIVDKNDKNIIFRFKTK